VAFAKQVVVATTFILSWRYQGTLQQPGVTVSKLAVIIWRMVVKK
jgi:hypothetical protein